MADKGYVVTAPLINVRVKDQAGSWVLQGFYEGARLPEDVHPDDLDKHLDKGMVAAEGSKEADAATPYGKPVTFDDLGNPLTPQQAAEAERKRTERASTRASRTTDTRTDARTQSDSKTSPAPTGRSEAKG